MKKLRVTVAIMLFASAAVFLNAEESMASDGWTAKANMPTARYGHAATVVNGKIYVMGGYNYSVGALRSLEVYDPATNTWTSGLADMLAPRFYFAAASVAGMIYAMGGMNFGGGAITHDRYDPSANTWTPVKPMLHATAWLAAVAVGGKIYAITGGSDIDEYDPTSNTWTSKAPMTTARTCSAAATVGGKIYVMGGYNAAQVILNTVEEYTPGAGANGGTWATKALMPTARYRFAAAVKDGKIYAIGGQAGSVCCGPDTILKTVEEYDPITDQWIAKAPMITARDIFGAVAVVAGVDETIYAFGGKPVMNKTEVYGPMYIDIGLRIHDGTGIKVVACEPDTGVTSAFRISKDNKVYGIALVDTTDPMASMMRVQTAAGIKAIRKF